jgi:two-component system response regulator PhoP
MRALIVEDEPQLREQLAEALRRQGYAVDAAADGEEGRYFSGEYDYDVAIMDLGLPKLDGISLIRQVRAAGKHFPILILTARDHWQEKVNGLSAGADDYLTKPFHIEEMLARLNALTRRAAGFANPVLRFGPVTIDTVTQSVRVHEQTLELTAYEYRLLLYLAHHPGKVVSKTELTEHLYDQDEDRDSNVLEVFIGRLRKKLDPDNSLQPIETLRGRGYRLVLAVSNG